MTCTHCKNKALSPRGQNIENWNSLICSVTYTTVVCEHDVKEFIFNISIMRSSDIKQCGRIQTDERIVYQMCQNNGDSQPEEEIT